MLAVSPDPVYEPGTVNLTATVTRALGLSGAPRGTVTFFYQSLAIGSVALNSAGDATLTASTRGLPEGFYSLTAQYSGDTSDNPSTSVAVVEPVQ
jgi:hypothetical protein